MIVSRIVVLTPLIELGIKKELHYLAEQEYRSIVNYG